MDKEQWTVDNKKTDIQRGNFQLSVVNCQLLIK